MKQLALVLFILLHGWQCYSQSSELSVFGGIASAKGDINRSLFQSRFFNPAYGLRYRYCFNNHWAYNISATRGKVEGDDQFAGNAFQRYRNLRYFTNVTELGANIEFNFFSFQTAAPNAVLSPYIFGGLNLFYFNPKTIYNGSEYELQPLGTEGQGTSQFPGSKKYKRVNFALGAGGGIKFKISRRFGLVVESGFRKTSTDYLDDVSGNYAKKAILLKENGYMSALLSDLSTQQFTDNNNLRQRGNVNDKDWYFFGGVAITFTLSKNYHNVCKPFKLKLH